jgi:hypothetical protein
MIPALLNLRIRGFNSGDASSGVTVSVQSSNDATLVANFAVSSSAPAGSHSVTVTASGQTSNAGSFFVQVPTSLSIVTGTSSTTSESSCSFTDINGNTQTGCGVIRSFMYQVNDQSGQPIQVAGLQVWDEINTTSPNNLGITGYVTTCTPANTGPCGFTTNSLGQFQENRLSVCAGACRVNNNCTTGGPTNANQVIHVGSYAITQSISYYCDHVTANGH